MTCYKVANYNGIIVHASYIFTSTCIDTIHKWSIKILLQYIYYQAGMKIILILTFGISMVSYLTGNYGTPVVILITWY